MNKAELIINSMSRVTKLKFLGNNLIASTADVRASYPMIRCRIYALWMMGACFKDYRSRYMAIKNKEDNRFYLFTLKTPGEIKSEIAMIKSLMAVEKATGKKNSLKA